MKLTEMKKIQTLWVFIAAYLFAIVIGSLVVLYGLNQSWNLVFSSLLSTVIMTIIIFIFSNITKNASLYDPYWSVIPIVIIIQWLLIYPESLSSIYNILLLIAVIVWGTRLTLNWWKNWDGFKHQDWRYTHLHDQAPKLYLITNFFGIHMIPTLVVYAQLINAHDIIIHNEQNPILILFVIGFVLSVIAAVIQYVADKQMYAFRMDNANRKRCIDEGLWKYSRHPNYLGELTFWVGIYVMYFSFEQNLNINIVYPILMILLFLFISIPMMEKKLSNRPGYIEYKKKVSMLLPYRKKSDN